MAINWNAINSPARSDCGDLRDYRSGCTGRGSLRARRMAGRGGRHHRPWRSCGEASRHPHHLQRETLQPHRGPFRKPRPVLIDAAKANADELRAVWGPFVAEAGTFELSGDLLTLRPTVAKNPAAMAGGAFTVMSYRLDGNVLTVTQVRNQNGPSPNPSTIKLTRVE